MLFHRMSFAWPTCTFSTLSSEKQANALGERDNWWGPCELLMADEIFDRTSECEAKLVNKTWLCRYPRCHHLIYNNGSEFKLHFKYLCESYGIKHKPTMVKNPRANGTLEHVHQVLRQMLRTAELDMANSVTPNDVNVFLDNAAWAICSTYHMVLKASPGAAIFGCNMIFDILFVADWHKIGEQRQSLTNCDNQRKNANVLTTVTRSEINY
jgi:hypothetical protein